MSKSKPTPDAKASDYWSLNPDDLVMGFRGRRRIPFDHIRDLAILIFTETQIQPVQIRNDGGKYKLIFGFSRCDAVKLIRKGFEHDGKTYHDPNFLLKCIPTVANEKTAFKRNIMENSSRLACSAIDNAENQQEGRERYGMSDHDLAELYKVSVQQITNLQRLLFLSDAHKEMVHDGTMALTTAYALLDLPESERDAALAAAMTETGKVKSEVVKDAVRARATSGQGGVNRTSTARSTATVRKYFECKGIEDSPLAELSKAIVGFMNGTVDQEALDAAWSAVTQPAEVGNKATVL